MDKSVSHDAVRRSTRPPIEFYDWAELKPAMPKDAKVKIELAFYKHILGLRQDQIAPYENAVYGFIEACRKDIGFSIRVITEPSFMQAEVERRFGGEVPHKRDYAAFWRDALKVMPVAISQDDVGRLVAQKDYSVIRLLNSMGIMHII